MVDTLIFDMGNVLLEWNAWKAIRAFEADEERGKELYEVIFASGIWEKQDTAELATAEAIDLVKNQLGEDYYTAIEGIFNSWYKSTTIYTELQNLAIEFSKKGYKLYILSNTCAVYYDLVKEGLLPIDAHLSGKVLSFEEKMMKPNPKIFKFLIDKYGLDPKCCVYLDDLVGNVAVAKSFDMYGITVKAEEQAVQDLQNLLQEVGVSA